MYKTTEYSGAFFDSKKSNDDLKKEYDQKLSALQSLVANLAPEDKTTLSTALPTSTACRVNPITNQWESVEERNKREYEASKELAALFTEQNDLEEGTEQFSKFNDILISQSRDILVKHQLQSLNPTLETTNQELLKALHQLPQKLKMPNNITRKNALVAIEVMDLLTGALNAHLANAKAEKSTKPLSKDEITRKLAELGKLLENDGINGMFFIILGTLLAVAGLTLLGGLVACATVPGFALSVCTMIGVTASINTASAVYSAGFIAFVFGLLSISVGGIILPEITKSSDANPEAAKAILDVSKAWDLEPPHCASPSITG
ncbi:MAG: hypothetical protein K2X50_00820 [Gammaproteobacteria bacterium]|nr:hypothetical protein [Gammaproteobacteria bacterium]